MSSREFDVIAVLHIEQLQLPDLARRGDRWDGFIAPDEHGTAARSLQGQSGLEEPCLVLVLLRRRLLVQQKERHQPTAGGRRSPPAANDDVRLVRVDAHWAELAGCEGDGRRSPGWVAAPHRAATIVAFSLDFLFPVPTPARRDRESVGPSGDNAREPE